MNINPRQNLLKFQQLEHYLRAKVAEKDLDHNGSPEQANIDNRDSHVRLIHHYDKRDSIEAKASIRERLHSVKSEVPHNQNVKQINKEMEMI